MTGLNEAFVVDRTTRDRLIADHPSSSEILKPFLQGRDVKRWRIDFNDQYLIRIESSENKHHAWSGKKQSDAENVFAGTYPAIYEHFKPLRPQLKERYDQGHYYWELRSCEYWEEFTKRKIIYPNICRRNEFAWDEEGYYANQKTFIIPEASKHLLAIMNSAVWGWLFEMLLAKLQNGFFEPSAVFLKDFPVPNVEPFQRKYLELMSDYLKYLARAKSHPKVNENSSNDDQLVFGYFEQLLNGLVYEIFFAEDLHSNKINLFKRLEEDQPPVLAEIPEKQRFSRLKEIHERISNNHHPIRGCLESLKSLEVVRIIEGEK